MRAGARPAMVPYAAESPGVDVVVSSVTVRALGSAPSLMLIVLLAQAFSMVSGPATAWALPAFPMLIVLGPPRRSGGMMMSGETGAGGGRMISGTDPPKKFVGAPVLR